MPSNFPAIVKTPRKYATRFLQISLVCLISGSLGGVARACPFCPAVSQTLAEEIAAGDAAVIAAYQGAANQKTVDGIELAAFKIVDVLKDSPKLSDLKAVNAIYFNKPEEGKKFYLLAADSGSELIWGTPIPLTDAGEAYLKQLNGLPKEGAERLEHFMMYLDHDDPMLAKDAYDEFTRASYQSLTNLAPKMDREELRKWINDPEVTATRRRLFFTLLGVCGNQEDADFLAGILRNPDERSRGLDALAGSYLTIAGEKGLPLLEDLFLRDKECDFSDTYAVIVALRFHLLEAEIIDDERLLASMRIMLDRPELADVVIADLARSEDWSAKDRLFELFKDAEKESTYIRIPIVRYMAACPEPEAKAYLAEMREMDPGSVSRALATYQMQGTVSKDDNAAEADPSEAETADTPKAAKTKDDEQPAEAEADTSHGSGSSLDHHGGGSSGTTVSMRAIVLGAVIVGVFIACGAVIIFVLGASGQTKSKDAA